MGFTKIVFAYILAVVVGIVLVTAIATQITLQELVALGIDVPMGIRIESVVRDLEGFTPTLGPILVIGFLIAFLVAAAVIHFIPTWRTFGYTLAGFTTVIVMMMAITAFYAFQLHSNITPVPASRTLIGLLTMAVGGAIAGWTFAMVSARRA